MSAVPQCDAKHPNPVNEEKIVVNDKGELKNVVISIGEGLPGGNYPMPEQPAMIDQVGCMYQPHIVAMRVGQKLLAKNSDAFMHNIHG